MRSRMKQRKQEILEGQLKAWAALRERIEERAKLPVTSMS